MLCICLSTEAVEHTGGTKYLENCFEEISEAERWLLIAEKLLAGRDLIGSKTFVIRARESELRLEAADQILAVADTLIAGEKWINNQPDWYTILQPTRLIRDTGLITTQYRQLTILLNPQRNHLPDTDEAFKLVCDAWSAPPASTTETHQQKERRERKKEEKKKTSKTTSFWRPAEEGGRGGRPRIRIPNDIPLLYLIYAVVVHFDTLNMSFSGHYVSYVKDMQGNWFKIDDTQVNRFCLLINISLH
ncbi:Ubiquitin carboxyl-terminal hydrolase 15 [Camellia lanceoleosa]|uniref:Ubiquitin carboxyl-terminal hydrolase 15 n=1 Tax=Camellia lanceoleosa TaxID=1840588 RepID=A0ACC0H095_9ERIC|nr:Ubiquitin carboxyl-terminal hydrolase 15 [Camellia lanceoleosa]